MKRADIKVGQHYLLNKSNEWRLARYPRDAKHVIVLDTRPWDKPSYYSSASKERPAVELQDGTTQKVHGGYLSERHGGNYVVVAEIDEDGKQGRAEVASLTSIRGDWEECNAIVTEVIERRTAANRAQNEKEQGLRARIRRQRDELKDLGIETHDGYLSRGGNFGTISFTLDQIDTLLNRLTSERLEA